MSYQVLLTDHFKKEAKKLIKKYASLPAELANLFEELSVNPTCGKHLGNDIYTAKAAGTQSVIRKLNNSSGIYSENTLFTW